MKSCGNVCHVYKSKKSSSQRTQIGAIASRVHSASLHCHAKRNCNHRRNTKIEKLHSCLMYSMVPHEQRHLCWSRADLDSYCLVFDGGIHGTPELKHPPMEPELKRPPKKKTQPAAKPHQSLPWKSLRISRGDLWVADTKDPHKGITYPASSGDAPFIRIPRKAALKITRMESIEESNKFCIALKYGYDCQRGSLLRSDQKKIFSDYKYVCMGTQPCRAKHGVRDATYHRESMPDEQWNFVVEMMKRTETALSEYVSTDAIRDLNHARRLLKFKTMAPADGCRDHSTKIFGGIAFGVDVHLACHTDQDYTYSVISIHIHGHQYSLHDRVVAYFCFPRLGIAVALRPGDILMFNPSEPHAVSSKCRHDDTVFCVSMYLKTAVVGLNDNSIGLTPSQEVMKEEYRKHILASKK